MNKISIFSLVVLCAGPTLANGEVIFEEKFDDQQDFTSTMHSTDGPQQKRKGYTLPDSWDSLYNGTKWSPETGHEDRHASLEILGSNSEKARGGTGKSAVNWRESYSKGWKNWASDSQLVKFLDKDHKELYIEFYIRFSDNWYERNQGDGWSSKIFRIGHYSGDGNEFSPSKGDAGPAALWYYKRDQYGIRNVLSFKGGPPGENYNDLPDKGGSLNYTSDTKGQSTQGSDPRLKDLVNGGYLSDFSGSTNHAQIFGERDKWTKVAFYVRMNTEVGEPDGVFRQWVNGEQILNREDIPWVMDNEDNKMVGWNYLSIGGNDYFQPYPNEERYEDWYAIDDLLVSTKIPNSPIPPNSVSVE